VNLRRQPVYSAHDHGVMIADRVRVGAYRRALERAVKPGDVVVDIGAGTGLFGLFACQFGARKVYAIEAEEIIDLGRAIAQKNGCADRIEFIHGHSTSVVLPERADVVVSDVHGALPIFGRGLESIRDAHRRFLKEGGILIPCRDRIWTAAVELPAEAYGQVAVWSDERWGVDLSPGTRFGVDCPFSAAVERSDLRTEPACIASIEHSAAESSTIGGAATLRTSHSGLANGYAVWFDAELIDGVFFTSAPGGQVGVYPRKFAPWTHPVDLLAGDTIEADIRFIWVNNDYVWRWNTSIRQAGGEAREQFRQSSFNSMFVSSEPLRRRAPTYRPRLNDKGEVERVILQLMDGGLGLREIAREVARQFPEVFSNDDAALGTVANLSEEFSS
jgi:protein arginine N-methyltransferase 1